MGDKAEADKARSVAVGIEAKANGEQSTAIGSKSEASSTNATALGTLSKALGTQSTAVGYGSEAKGYSAFAGGFKATAAGGSSVALGETANSSGSNAVSIGAKSIASGPQAIAIGLKANATLLNGIALGNEARADRSSIAVGNGAYVGAPTTSGEGSPGYKQEDNQFPEIFVIYQNKAFRQSNAIAMGLHTKAFGYQTMALGSAAEAYNTNSAAVGLSATAKGDFSFAVGHQAKTNGINASAFGRQANANAKDALSLGSFSLASEESSVALGAYSVANTSKDKVGYDAQGRYFDQKSLLKDKETEFNQLKTTIAKAETEREKSIQAYHDIIDGNDAKQDRIAAINEELRKKDITADQKTALNKEKADLQKEIKGSGTAMGTVFQNISKKDKEIAEAKLKLNKIQADFSTWSSTAAAVSVGNADLGITRQITNLAAGTNDTDAVNVAQLKALATMPVYIRNGAPTASDDLAKLTPSGDLWKMDLSKLSFSFGEGLKAEKKTVNNKDWIFVSLDDQKIQSNPAIKGEKGEDGKSAYDVWHALPGNENKTPADFSAALSAGAGDNAQIRQEVTDLTTNVTRHTQEIQDVRTNVTQNTQAVQQLRTEHDSLKSQVQENHHAIQQLDRNMYKMNKELRAGIAGAMAAGQIYPVAGKTMSVGAAVGTYRGQSAVAVGVRYVPKSNVVVSLSGTADTGHGVGAATGVSVGW